MTESELKALVVDIAHSNEWRVFSLPMIKNMRPVKDAVGYPDLTLARNGRILFLELKAEDGVLGPEQMHWMRALGPYMFVCRPSNIDDIRFLLT